MSFIYAEKKNLLIDGKIHPITHIYSDTKITLEGTSTLNWGDQTRKAISRYGMIKTIIISPKCCISFAGNNILFAHLLFEKLYALGSVSENDIVQFAFDIHNSASKNDIEFLICYADDNDETHIICIKERQVHYDCQVAWIGSNTAFSEMQRRRIALLNQGISLSSSPIGNIYRNTINECSDKTVGGFEILTIYDQNQHSFFYSERVESISYHNQEVLIGNYVELVGTAENGSYTMQIHESQTEVLIDIIQPDLSILYTNRLRMCPIDANCTHTRYFMLPIPIRTSTNLVVGIS